MAQESKLNVSYLIQGKKCIVVLRGTEGELVFNDELNPLSARAREEFISKVMDKFKGIDRAELEEELRNAADNVLKALATVAEQKQTQGLPPFLLDPDPWPEEVDGAELLDEMAGVIGKYVIMPSHEIELAACWALWTWCFNAFDSAPILAITSPERRCGKSRLLEVLEGMVARPLKTSTITAASLFRIIEKYKPTLLIDEADTFLNDSPELRGVINAGWRRNEPAVRCREKDNEPELFDVFCPKAIAAIGELPDTIADRAFVLRMKRKLPGERVAKLRHKPFKKETADIRRKCRRWADDHFDELPEVGCRVPEGLNDRLGENAEVLLTIATVAGGDWPERIRKVVLAQAGQDNIEEGLPVLLLKDLRTLFDETGEAWLPTSEITSRLNELEERPWSNLRSGKGLDSNKLARLLRRFNVKSERRLDDGTRCRGYSRQAFEDAWNRYLDPVPGDTEQDFSPDPSSQPVHPSTTLKLQENFDFQAVHKLDSGTGSKNQKGLINQPDGQVDGLKPPTRQKKIFVIDKTGLPADRNDWQEV